MALSRHGARSLASLQRGAGQRHRAAVRGKVRGGDGVRRVHLAGAGVLALLQRVRAVRPPRGLGVVAPQAEVITLHTINCAHFSIIGLPPGAMLGVAETGPSCSLSDLFAHLL